MTKPFWSARAIARFSVDRGHPANGVPSGLAMSQMIRATRSEPAYVQGKTSKVSRSGLRYMSDSSIRTNPSIDEPSNMMAPSSASPNCRSGTSTFLLAPRMSVKCRRMNFTFSRSTRSRMRARRSAFAITSLERGSLEPLLQREREAAHVGVDAAPLALVIADKACQGREIDADAGRQGVGAEVADAVDREVLEVLDAGRVAGLQPHAWPQAIRTLQVQALAGGGAGECVRLGPREGVAQAEGVAGPGRDPLDGGR